MKKSNDPARWRGFLLLTLLTIEFAPTAHAGAEEFAQCAKKYQGNDAERLKCYDSALNAVAAPVSLPLEASTRQDDENAAPVTLLPPGTGRSYLSRAWNLDNMSGHDKSRMGHLIPHRQNYLMVRKTFNSNTQPASPAPNHSVLTPNDIDALETKFQLSLKADLIGQHEIEFRNFKTIRLWGAYTQQSNWQMFNKRNSSPFRETNYEPELIATFGTGNISGFKLVNLGWAHQSNGQRLPESRSWNRLYLQGGWEWDNTSVLARGWYRIPENSLKDDNPDITNYVGRADLVLRQEFPDQKQSVTMLLRNNLNFPGNHGFMQLDWSLQVPWANSVLLHAQLTSGFGESLIDYNHRQTTLGLGFSFREW